MQIPEDMDDELKKLWTSLVALHHWCRDYTREKYRRVNPSYEELFDWSERGRYWTQMKARRRFVVNVLDRTPHTVCDACGNTSAGKKCQSCKADISKNEFTPLNQIKILEGGPELFNKSLNPIEKMYSEDYGVGIDGYDIVFMTQGVGRDRQVAPTPLQPEALPEEAFLDEEGNPQQKFDLELLAEPTSVEEIEAYLEGATIAEVNEMKGVKPVEDKQPVSAKRGK